MNLLPHIRINIPMQIRFEVSHKHFRLSLQAPFKKESLQELKVCPQLIYIKPKQTVLASRDRPFNALDYDWIDTTFISEADNNVEKGKQYS